MYCSEAALIFWTQAVLEEKQRTTTGWLFPRTCRLNQEPKALPLFFSRANLSSNKFPITGLTFLQHKNLFAN